MASALVGVVRARIDAYAFRQPMPGVEYLEVLDVDTGPLGKRTPVILRGVAGVMLGVVTFVVVTPLVAYSLIALSWLLAGSPGEFTDYYRDASLFNTPAGMAAAHLGLAMLLPISMALIMVVHRVHPRWLHSVQPGVRWRLLLITLGVAAVVLNVVLWVSQVGDPMVFSPQQGFWGFVVVILLTSPLQAAAEEYFFRGYLIQAIHPMVRRSPWFGVVGSAAIFALFHGTQDLPLFLDRFGFGILAGVLVVKTGGLEAAIAAHVINNVFAFIYAGLTSTIADVKATTTLTWVDAAWDLVGFGLYAVAAVWVARRMQVATTTPGTREMGAVSPSES